MRWWPPGEPESEDSALKQGATGGFSRALYVLSGASFFIFMGAVLAGILAGVAGSVLAVTGLETVLALALIAAGVAAAIAAPHWFGYALFGSVLFYQGVIHAMGMPAGAPLASFVAGLMFATALLMSLGTLLRHVIITRRPPEGATG